MPIAFLSDVGPAELILVFAAILVFFGPKRLPEVARTIGRVMNDLRRASRDFQDQVMQIDQETQPDEPSAHPIGPESVPQAPLDSGAPDASPGPDAGAKAGGPQTAGNPHHGLEPPEGGTTNAQGGAKRVCSPGFGRSPASSTVHQSNGERAEQKANNPHDPAG